MREKPSMKYYGLRWTLYFLIVLILYMLTFPVVKFYVNKYAPEAEAVERSMEYYRAPHDWLCRIGHIDDNVLGYDMTVQERLQK
jgi:hypothetical protein